MLFAPFFHAFLILSLAVWPFDKDKKDVEIKKIELDLPARPQDFQTMRVSVLEGVTAFTLATDNRFHIEDKLGQPLLHGERIVATPIKPNDRGLQVGLQTFREHPIRITSGAIQVDNRVYRDKVTVSVLSQNKLRVVNELGLDDYLRGVLPWEANPVWPLEALKAQAVASRTFAFFKAVERQQAEYHLGSTVMSQVYKGKGIEKPQTDTAIAATKGEILIYHGKIFSAYFHSTCGGRTTDAATVWPVEAVPVLKGVSCEFCQGSKHYRWHARYEASEIRSIINAKGYQMGPIDQIKIAETDKSGRATALTVHSGSQKLKLNANDLRIWLGPGRFKSTFLDSIHQQGSVFSFFGRGWGHGVGMCQYGMKRLAELGYDYKQILEFYYPGAQIRKLE